VIVVQKLAGQRIDGVEASVGWVVLGLVLMRQVVTLFQNTVQLERVSATQAELAYRAQHDPLTGLANRVLFGERLLGAMAGHREEGRRYALLLVDLDDFKAINDSLGHAVGDALLHAVAQRLRDCVRSTDTVARIGGDEFAVVLDGATEEPGIVGERIVTALQEPFVVDCDDVAAELESPNGRDRPGVAVSRGRAGVSLGASVGVVEPRADEIDLTPEVLLRRADGAMYVGKRRGKGRAVHYEPERSRGWSGDQAEDRRRRA
jgi:diguanylate cyclase (GGDEF)-like protein